MVFNIWDFDALVEVEVLLLDTIELETDWREIISEFELFNGNTVEFVIPIVFTELEVFTYAADKRVALVVFNTWDFDALVQVEVL